ncbi:hypothetical protein [Rhodocyclus tenuis]|uniref:hypothetical protein n=1 Tax=Rhodocyclus tenuis TaxID=1066 RepID=UPI0019081C24|nr:hypothetical protein [Rhodocyclus tenuis]
MSRSIRLSLLAFSIVLSGCATEAVLPHVAKSVPAARISSGKYLSPTEEVAQLTFVRDSGLYGVGVTIYLFIDGEEIAGFRPEEKLIIYLPKGEYLLGVQSKSNFGIEQFIETPIRIDASKNYGFRISIDYNKAVVQRTSSF